MQQDKQVRRRKRRDDDEIKALLEGWTKSGLSARAFGSREGVKPSCLWRWKRSIEKRTTKSEEENRPAITFAPVHVTSAEPRPGVAPERVHAEVVLGRALVVRVFDGADAVQVSRLVHALAGAVSC